MKQWVDTFMKIPFNKYANLPITAEDGVEKCHGYGNTQKILNDAVYGMNDAKNANHPDGRAMDYKSIGDWHRNCNQGTYGYWQDYIGKGWN